jgi:hypothetical protein
MRNVLFSFSLPLAVPNYNIMLLHSSNVFARDAGSTEKKAFKKV